MAREKKVSKKTKVPAKKASSKGLLSRLFGKTETKSSSKSQKASLKKATKKTPVKAAKTTTAPKKKKPLKEPKTSGKIVPIAPMHKRHINTASEASKTPIHKELVVESSYVPEPFKGSSFTLKKGKILTAEGWQRIFEEDR